DQIIQPALQQDEQVFTRHTRQTARAHEVAAHLGLADVIDESQLLLFVELQAVFSAAARAILLFLAVLARRIGTLLKTLLIDRARHNRLAEAPLHFCLWPVMRSHMG